MNSVKVITDFAGHKAGDEIKVTKDNKSFVTRMLARGKLETVGADKSAAPACAAPAKSTKTKKTDNKKSTKKGK